MNQAPVLGELPAIKLAEGETTDVVLSAADADGDTLGFDIANNPSFVTISSSHTLHIAPGYDAVTGSATEKSFTVEVSVNDGAAGHTAKGSLTLTVTAADPTIQGSLEINAGAAFTNSGTVSLAITGTSAAGAISEMRFSNDGTTFSAAEPFAATKSWTLDSSADGAKTVTVELKDAAGNTKTYSASITLDTAAPSISAFTINNGATATNSGSVLLTVTASDTSGGSGVGEIEASNDGATFTSLSSNPANWALAASDATQTVTIRVSDKAGNSATATAQILLDTTAPTITTATLNGGMTWSNSSTVTLDVTATDASPSSNLHYLCVSGDVAASGCLQYPGSSFPIALSSGDGAKQVSVTVTDEAGNVSQASTAQVSVDTTAPTLSSLTIDNGAAATSDLTLTLDTVASDATPGSGLATISFSTDLITWSTPESYIASKTLTVSSGDGARTYWARVTDLAGNTSIQPYPMASILIDQTPPSGGSVRINNNASATNSPDVTLTLTGTDATSGVTNVCLKSGTLPITFTQPAASDPCWQTAFAPSLSYTLTASANGSQRVFAWLMDAAGNVLSTPVTDDIFLDRTTPTAPSNLAVVSVSYRTITLSYTAATDPAPSSGLAYQFGYRLQGSTGPFTYVSPSGSSGGNLLLQLSAANSYEIVLRASDSAGNRSADSNAVTATTYFPWTHELHVPTAQPQPLTGAAVIGATHFAVSSENGGADGAEAWVDDSNGFQTFKRLDTPGRAIVPVGATSRTLFVNPFEARFTADLGTTLWSVATVSGTTLQAGTFVKSTTANGTTVDSFVLVGSSGSIYRGDVTSGTALRPSGSFSRVATTAVGSATLRSVATCSACAGDVVVAVGDSGTIIRSTDGGATWTAINAPASSSTLSSIVSVPGSQIMYAIGGRLIVSTDGGASWIADPKFTQNANALAVGGDASGYTLWIAGGAFSPLLYRYDGTNSPTFVSLSSLSPAVTGLYGVAAIGTGATAQAIVVGDNADIVHISAGGTAVARRSSGPNALLFGVSFAEGSSESALMGTNSGIAYSTQNHGQTWTQESTGTTQQIRSTYMFADESAVAVGGGGAIVKRSPTGTWSSASWTGPALTTFLYHVACVSPSQCLAAGTNNSAASYDSTSNTAIALSPFAAGTAAYYGSALTSDSSNIVHGVLVGANGAVRICTGCTVGSSFLPETTVPAPTFPGSGTIALNGVQMKPNGRVIAVGTQGGTWGEVWTSNNYGSSWVATNYSQGFTLNAVANVPGTNTWYATGDRSIVISKDDGATWTSINSYTYLSAYGLAVAGTASAPALLITGNYGLTLYSGTGGQ